MSDSEPGEALVIVHPLLAPALERNIAEVLAPAIWRSTTAASLCTTAKLRLCNLSGADWHQLLHEIGPEDRQLQQLFSVRSGPAIYFGIAPVSIAIELGRRLGPTHRVLAYYGGARSPGARPVGSISGAGRRAWGG